MQGADDFMTTGKIPIYSVSSGKIELVEPVERTDAEWKAILPPQTFEIARKKGTEPAFTGSYYKTHDEGIYQCACCGTDLFDSKLHCPGCKGKRQTL
jgi:peptide-methionine (R)-S-oxide reductase